MSHVSHARCPLTAVRGGRGKRLRSSRMMMHGARPATSAILSCCLSGLRAGWTRPVETGEIWSGRAEERAMRWSWWDSNLSIRPCCCTRGAPVPLCMTCLARLACCQTVCADSHFSSSQGFGLPDAAGARDAIQYRGCMCCHGAARPCRPRGVFKNYHSIAHLAQPCARPQVKIQGQSATRLGPGWRSTWGKDRRQSSVMNSC